MNKDDLISRAGLLCSLNEQAPKPTTDDLYTVNMCIINAPAVDAVSVVRCKDCKHYEVKDVWVAFGSIPILVSDVPMCNRWECGCKTSPDGFCFLGERRESE